LSKKKTQKKDVVGNPVLALSPAVAFGCGWRAAPARWVGQALGAVVAAALAATVMPPLARVAVAAAPAPGTTAPAPGAGAATPTTHQRQQRGGGGRGGSSAGTTPAAAVPSEREPLLPTTATPPGL
jgi:hypothetical protein